MKTLLGLAGFLLVSLSVQADVFFQFGMSSPASPHQVQLNTFTELFDNSSSVAYAWTPTGLDQNVAPGNGGTVAPGDMTVTVSSGPVTNQTYYGFTTYTGSAISGTSDYLNLYQSFLGSNLNTNDSTWLKFQNLAPNATFLMTFYAYDSTATSSSTMTFTDYTFYGTTSQSGNSATVTWTGGQTINTDTANTVQLVITTDANGQAIIGVGGTDKGQHASVVNGVIISPMATYIQTMSTNGSAPVQPNFHAVQATSGGSGINTTIPVETDIAPSGSLGLGIRCSTNVITYATWNSTPVNSGAFTYGPVYQSYLGCNVAGGDLTIKLTGLASDSPFLITLYAYDSLYSGHATFTDYTAQYANSGNSNITPGDVGKITWGSAPTTNNEYAVTLSVMSDSSGTVFIKETGGGNNPNLGSSTYGLLNAIVVQANIHSRLGMGEGSSAYSAPADDTQGDENARLALYKNCGVGSIRTQLHWEDFETTSGVYLNPEPMLAYNGYVTAAGNVLDYELGIYGFAPTWYINQNANCQFYDTSGAICSDPNVLSNFWLFNNSTLSPLSGPLLNIVQQLDKIMSTIQSESSICTNINFLILDGGHFGEQHYPPGTAPTYLYWWGKGGPSTNEALSNFQNAMQVQAPTTWTKWYYNAGNGDGFGNPNAAGTTAMPWPTAEPGYGPNSTGLAAANAAWGTGFTSWADVNFPAQGSTTVTGTSGSGPFTFKTQFMSDILTWYRNSMRDLIDFEIQQTLAAIKAYPFTETSGPITITRVPKLAIFVGDHTTYPPPGQTGGTNNWTTALTNPASAPATTVLYGDAEFIIQEAYQYGLVLHYVSEEDTSDVNYLSNYLLTNTPPNVSIPPFMGENGGPPPNPGPSGEPVLCANNTLSNNQFNYEYVRSSVFLNTNAPQTTINTSIFDTDPGYTNLDVYQGYQAACQNLLYNYSNPTNN